ncbi:MAG: D-aminoacyl-tRNA deacylase [Myxococcota bacterium]
MRTVVQRVRRAAVRVDGETVGEVGIGLLLLVGVERGDTSRDAQATAQKIAKMRVFPGRTPMDQCVTDLGGSCLVVSQFTLAAAIRKGNRPSFTAAADPEDAEPLYLEVASALEALGITVAKGQFGADMEVELVNDGPATFLVSVRDGAVYDLP